MADTHRPRALAVISDLPWPPRSGNHWRYLQNLRLLDALGYELGVVAGGVRPDASDASLGEHGRLLDVVAVDQPAVDIAARLSRLVGLSANLIGRRPRDPWAQQHRRAGYDDAVLRAVATFRPDVVLVRSTFAHIVPGIRSSVARVVIDAHDSDAIYAGMLEGTARPWQRPGLRLRRLNAMRAERTFGQADELWAPARRELDYFRRRRPGLSCLLVPNGVPVPAVAPARDPDGRTLLLFGAFGLPMNLAAADALVDRVLPAVLAACPRCRVALAGTGMPEARLRRWRDLPVDWLGQLDDLGPQLARAQAFVFVPPSTFGSGTPLKVSEALAAGTPVVTTPVIADGLGLICGRNAIVDADPGRLAEGIVRLLSDDELAGSLGAAGHSRARELLSFESVLERVRAGSVLVRDAA